MKIINVLLVLAIIVLGLVAAIGILSMPETDGMMSFVLLTIGSKVIGFIALYYTCRLIAYFNKINDIRIPKL